MISDDLIYRYICNDDERKVRFEVGVLYGKLVKKYRYEFDIKNFSVPMIRCIDRLCCGYCMVVDSDCDCVKVRCVKCGKVFIGKWKELELGFICVCGKDLWFKFDRWRIDKDHYVLWRRFDGYCFDQ